MTQDQPRVAGKALLAAVALICIATSKAPPVPPADVPMWSIASQPLTLPCGTADVWVSKSGKTGLGITVRIAPTRSRQASEIARPSRIAVDPDSPPPIAADPQPAPGVASPEPVGVTSPIAASSPDCRATVGASLAFADRAFVGRPITQTRGSELQAPGRQDSRGTPDPALLDATYYYLAFELDNEARWNRGDRSAILELSIDVGGRVTVWRLPATHAYREWPASR